MTNRPAATESTQELRLLAEEKYRSTESSTPVTYSPEESAQLLHELRVHQIELEMQNTELRRMQHDLETTKASYFDLYELAPVGYLTISERGVIQKANLAAVSLFNTPREDLLNKPITKLIFREDQTVFYLQRNQIADENEVQSWDMRLVRVDGSSFWAHLQTTPVHNGEYLVTFSDISERKLADTYKDISREVLMILNEQGKLKDVIPKVIASLKAGTGFDAVGIRLQEGDDYPYFSEEGFPKELLLKGNSLVVRDTEGVVSRDKDGKARLECTCGLVISGKIKPGHPLFTPGGSFWTNDSFPLLDQALDADPCLIPRNECIHHKYVSIALVPIRDSEKIVGLIQFNDHRKNRLTLNSVELLEGVAGHIGAALMRKRYEDEKRLLEAKLQQSQKMEAIGQLAGGVAHDFNNKLMAILGYAELSKMDIHDSDKILHYLDEIRRAAEQSRDITFRLLAFSRQQVISPQALEANKVIADALKSLARLIGEHISISFQPYDKLWNIRMDPVQLDQVVMNLVINARDAMPAGGSLVIETGNITMDAGSCSAIVNAVPGDYVMVTFRDSGTGMDKETLTHIFEPFFTTKEVGKGTGLGLATIHGIIHQNSGFIDVTSSVGQGTEFKVYIPRFSEPIKEPATTADAISTGSCTILLVEDEDAVRNVISLFLKKIGYTVHEAATPTVALELAADPSIQIDLVLTDYVMPVMNGRAMMELIHELRPQSPCIYASGFSTEHVQLSEEAHFIQKPYDLIKLSGLLKRVASEGVER
jgi:PAS domain S-box-containing protein